MRFASRRCIGRLLGSVFGTALLLAPIGALATESCPGHPDALGTSRTIVVDPAEHANIGTMQYSESLPLADHEVVITFDDGPLPRYSNRILDALDAECVKATYFLVGKMAEAYPKEARIIRERGHTIGTHSYTHPLTFHRMSEDEAGEQIDKGIAAVAQALGDPKAVAPFFRIPGLLKSKTVEAALAKRGLMNWSADFPADDWKHISSEEVTKRALSRLEAKGRGILLLHDIHANTAGALPVILRELKRRGYKVVHVVPADAENVKTATAPEDWIMRRPRPAAPAVADAAKPNGDPEARAAATAENAAKKAKDRAERKQRAEQRKLAAHHKQHDAKTDAKTGTKTSAKTGTQTAAKENRRTRTQTDAQGQFGHAMFDGDVRTTQSLNARAPRLAAERSADATSAPPAPAAPKLAQDPPAPEKTELFNLRAPFSAAADLLRPIIP